MKCPLCGKARVHEFRPFCSMACKQRDLLNWLGDGYAIPGEPLAVGNDLDLEESPSVFIPPAGREDD